MNLTIKRVFSTVVAVVIAVVFLSVPFIANAQEPVKLTVTSVKGEANRDVTVSIIISANSNLAAADLILRYDNTKLLYKSDVAGSAAEGGFFSINPNFKSGDNPDVLKITYIHADGIMAEGTLLDVTFTVTSNWSGSTAVSLEVNGDFVDATYKTISYEIVNGTVSVGAESDSNVTTNASDSTVKKSSQKMLVILFSIVFILAAGAAAAYFIIRKK